MLRFIPLLMAATLLLPTPVSAQTAAPAAAAAAVTGPVSLRSAVSVEDKLVRLADIFEGPLADGTIAIAQAPAPGSELTLDARWLSKLASAHKIAWRPTSRFDQVTVSRAVQTITAKALNDAVSAALADQGHVPDITTVKFHFDNEAAGLKLPMGTAAGLGVENLSLDAKGRFSATVKAPATGPAVASTVVSGQILSLTEVPVASRRILPGEPIRAEDLDWVGLRTDTLAATTVVDPSQLIGMTPRRPARPGEPFRANEIQPLLTIKKGSLVTMVLDSPSMVLTVQARATEDGAEGQVIRVVNTKSNRTVNALVKDAGTVTVALDSSPVRN